MLFKNKKESKITPDNNPIICYDKDMTFRAMQEFISYQEESIRNFDWTRCKKNNSSKRIIEIFIEDLLIKTKKSAFELYSQEKAPLNKIISSGVHIKESPYNEGIYYLCFGEKENWIEKFLQSYGYKLEPEKEKEPTKYLLKINVEKSVLNIDKHIEDTKEKYKDFDWDSYIHTVFFNDKMKDRYQDYLDHLHKIKISILQGNKLDDLPCSKEVNVNFSISYFGSYIEICYLRNPIFSFDTIVEKYFVKKDK